ncbi:hypothetical protein Misp01_83370 [Microtetraspora sp. NBRC 13810]|uniref:hypothetical protein n=1 Tax=Microtetraspora sp. NBRC 13810 TaxID=3030990 RepID=UPI0024A032AE|nr:hypothetical protein [Microtetraspora sp. NBRC 13810]GLW13209.1 hypothetical protein Misp01_83370 [Microtetraspora sp. NBRC 13810]
MRTEFVPGSMFKFPVEGHDHAFALMLAEFPYVAFYGKDASFDDAGVPVDAPMFTILVAKSAYSSGGWGKPISQLPKEALPSIPRFFWQSPVKKNDCKIVEPIKRRVSATPSECVGLEPEAIWSAGHIVSRIVDTYAGRPNAFVESLRVKL